MPKRPSSLPDFRRRKIAEHAGNAPLREMWRQWKPSTLADVRESLHPTKEEFAQIREKLKLLRKATYPEDRLANPQETTTVSKKLRRAVVEGEFSFPSSRTTKKLQIERIFNKFEEIKKGRRVDYDTRSAHGSAKFSETMRRLIFITPFDKLHLLKEEIIGISQKADSPKEFYDGIRQLVTNTTYLKKHEMELKDFFKHF